MRTFGRYHEVRDWWIPTGEVSAPLLLNRRTGELTRSDTSSGAREWEAIDEGRHQQRVEIEIARLVREQLWDAKRAVDRRHLVDRLLRRDNLAHLAAFAGRTDTYNQFLTDLSNSVSQTTLALDSAYAIGATGDAISGRLQTHQARTLNEVYYHITGYTGTAVNVNDINIEVRPEASAGAITPHTSTLTDSQTNNPASATGWVKQTGFTAALAAASNYYVIVGDADGNGTDNATVLALTSAPWTYAANAPTRLGSVRTTGGFASGNTAATQSSVPSLVLKFSDGSITGSSITTPTTPASDTNRRGLRITNTALVAALDVFGARWETANANISGVEFWSADTGPSGTADNVSTDILWITGGSTRIGAMVSGGGVYRLNALTAYSIVATYSGATNAGPRRHDIGTGEDATLRAAMPGNGQLYFRRANGTSDWSNDLVGSIPTMGLLIESGVAVSASGGVLIGGMRGGFVN